MSITTPQYLSWKIPTELIPHNRAIIFISTLGILSNLFLLVHFFRNRSLINVSSATLVQIAVCDFIFFISSAVMTISHEAADDYELPGTFCQVGGFVAILSLGTSSLSFVVIAVERYLRVIHGKKITAMQLCGMCLVAWSSSTIQAIIPLATATYFIPQDSNWYCLGDFSGVLPGHRAYSIFSLISAYTACSIVTFAYYSIYRKTTADGFKWNDLASKASKSTAPKAGNESKYKHSTTSGGTSITPSSNINSFSAGDSVAQQAGNRANVQQMRLTLRLAFYNCYFLSIWVGTVLSWTYQAITTSRIHPNLDYALTFIPVFGSVLNPILVLTIDQRWKVRLPRFLEIIFKHQQNHIPIAEIQATSLNA
ncbi:hypothetical protein BKA69DRAFT_1174190 [Paraphysoderma sedebokerense]|nr:hypothetical protein BKA69DRAFT_1174190 [Paraphysoderma sedebokerense]